MSSAQYVEDHARIPEADVAEVESFRCVAHFLPASQTCACLSIPHSLHFLGALPPYAVKRGQVPFNTLLETQILLANIQHEE